jgi:predicted deacylase
MTDRHDLNRSFLGSAKGSLAARVAHIFLNEIVGHCDYGIDLHTVAFHRSNISQIRADLSDEKTKELALAFGVPVVLNPNLVDGSLRESAVAKKQKYYCMKRVKHSDLMSFELEQASKVLPVC